MSKVRSNHKTTIFVGLMLGMLVAATSQTIVAPAMPVIVAELGGIEHYSWIATSTLLVSAVTIPIVGKLSDIYGRRGFYIAGLVIFMLGSILAGAAQGFWWLVGARAIQGLGMGSIMSRMWRMNAGARPWVGSSIRISRAPAILTRAIAS